MSSSDLASYSLRSAHVFIMEVLFTLKFSLFCLDYGRAYLEISVSVV